MVDEALLRFDENYKIVCDNIANAARQANRKPEDITLLMASKTVDVQVINYAYSKGIKVMGENKVQEFLSKEESLEKGLKRHLIGSLQTNKVKQIVGKVELIHSLDSIRLAKEIDKISLKKGIVSNVLIEVNIADEESKGGIKINELEEFIEEVSLLKGICVQGLMTMGPADVNFGRKNEYFSKMHKLFIDNRAKKVDNVNINILSMGMSDDYELAILNGATIVRVGSALFGHRI